VFTATVNVKLEKAVLIADAREQAKEVREAQQLAVKTALGEYRRGEIDATALTAALLLAGIAAPVAAGYVSLAAVGVTPNVRIGEKQSQFVVGQTEQKALARAAIEAYKKALITVSALRSQLASAGFSALEIDYEVAYLDALAAKKPPPPV